MPTLFSHTTRHLVRVLVVNVRVEILAVAVCRNPSQHFLVALALRQRLLLQRRGVELEPTPRNYTKKVWETGKVKEFEWDSD